MVDVRTRNIIRPFGESGSINQSPRSLVLDTKPANAALSPSVFRVVGFHDGSNYVRYSKCCVGRDIRGVSTPVSRRFRLEQARDLYGILGLARGQRDDRTWPGLDD